MLWIGPGTYLQDLDSCVFLCVLLKSVTVHVWGCQLCLIWLLIWEIWTRPGVVLVPWM